jgi:hypothetical protein
MSKTKTLCHMAWDYPMFFMFTNSIGYCCRTPRIAIDPDLLEELGEDFWSNHPKFVERRQALLNGVKHVDCDTCWSLEDAGFKSSRNDNYIQYFMRKNDKNFPVNTPFDEYKNYPGIEKSNYSNVIEIVLNNTCDAKCTYCSEFYSTQWLTEKKKHNEVSRSYRPQDVRNPRAEELFWSWYENKVISTNRRFGFIGGEPLIIDALYECFDKLLEIHDRKGEHSNPHEDKMELCITSNMNTPPAYFEKFLNYVPRLEKYFTIIIQVSGENIGDDLEYVRHGVKWERWSKNVEHLLAHTNVNLAFLPCLNILSIPRFHLYLEYFAELCNKYKFMRIHNNIVTHPIEQSPLMAPKEFAVYFDKCIDTIQSLVDKKVDSESNPRSIHVSYVNFLDWLHKTRDAVSNNSSENEENENANKFFRFFSQLDFRRKTSLLTVFPEMKSFYNAGANGLLAPKKTIPIQEVK